MKSSNTTGLVVGKFAPFHSGHHHLLACAYASMDKLVVMLYDAPDCTNVPLVVRAHWIHAAFGRAVVIEGHNPPPRGVWNEYTMRQHEDFVKKLVGLHDITHVYSGEAYGERLALALGAEHVLVEKIFGELPLSATSLRRNPMLYQQYVQENVYGDLVKYGDTTL
ncbi:MAG: NAD metabolism ATPase/kinase [Parcubacteria group bacterium Gr01-1014_29]|nr:MAG: NAD metabolism ATPase/kinase [Parcubacteria group bacterium Gr01-1014_29]